MVVNNIDVTKTIEQAREALDNDKKLSAPTKEAFKPLLEVVTILLDRIGLNSRNSSKPPSQDPNRPKKPKNKTIE